MKLNRLHNFFDFALTLFYPQDCLICAQSVEARRNGFVCETCWQETKTFDANETMCWKCGCLMRGSVSENERAAIHCGQCGEDSYDAARSVGIYADALRASILRLKITPFVAARLNELVYQTFINSPFSDATKIIPVPLSAKRREERGFNQAELLARSLALKLTVSLDAKSLVRCIHTEKLRAGMDRIERRKSVTKAFEAVRPRLIENERILLIDDVLTSGATVSGCAEVLKKAGAAKVYVLTAARVD